MVGFLVHICHYLSMDCFHIHLYLCDMSGLWNQASICRQNYFHMLYHEHRQHCFDTCLVHMDLRFDCKACLHNQRNTHNEKCRLLSSHMLHLSMVICCKHLFLQEKFFLWCFFKFKIIIFIPVSQFLPVKFVSQIQMYSSVLSFFVELFKKHLPAFKHGFFLSHMFTIPLF